MVMEKRNSLMKKHSVLLAAAVLAISTGIAQAKTSDHRMTGSSYGTGMTVIRAAPMCWLAPDPWVTEPRTRFRKTVVRRV
jgi:hypothetical protein